MAPRCDPGAVREKLFHNVKQISRHLRALIFEQCSNLHPQTDRVWEPAPDLTLRFGGEGPTTRKDS